MKIVLFIYLFIFDKKLVFDKYKEILENIRNIIKNKFNLYIVKKYLKAEKINTKGGFGCRCLYAPVILID